VAASVWSARFAARSDFSFLPQGLSLVKEKQKYHRSAFPLTGKSAAAQAAERDAPHAIAQ
jgi:hypothetical protein